MKKEDFKVGVQFMIDRYKVPAKVTWRANDGGDFAIKTLTYNDVNMKLKKRGIQLYTCFGTEMLYSRIIPYERLTPVP